MKDFLKEINIMAKELYIIKMKKNMKDFLRKENAMELLLFIEKEKKLKK